MEGGKTMMKTPSIDRRHFLMGGIGAGSIALGVGAGVLGMTVRARATTVDGQIPLPLALPDEISLESVRFHAFNNYWQAGCMYGAATGLIEAIKEALPPGEGRDYWELIPYGMYKYGAGGVSGWGTICGALNGAIAVLNLVNLHGTYGNELMGWYSTTSFPTGLCEDLDTDPAPIPDADVLAHTVSDSPLCHVSLGNWLNAAGVDPTAEDFLNQKKDRCAKVTADTAARAAELINTGVTSYEMPAHFEDCFHCHSVTLKNEMGKMDCLGCHTTTDAALIERVHPTNKTNGRGGTPSGGKGR